MAFELHLHTQGLDFFLCIWNWCLAQWVAKGHATMMNWQKFCTHFETIVDNLIPPTYLHSTRLNTFLCIAKLCVWCYHNYGNISQSGEVLIALQISQQFIRWQQWSVQIINQFYNLPYLLCKQRLLRLLHISNENELIQSYLQKCELNCLLNIFHAEDWSVYVCVEKLQSSKSHRRPIDSENTPLSLSISPDLAFGTGYTINRRQIAINHLLKYSPSKWVFSLSPKSLLSWQQDKHQHIY